MSLAPGPWLHDVQPSPWHELVNAKTGPEMVIVSPTIPVGALFAVTEISAASEVTQVTTHTVSLEQATTQQLRAHRQTAIRRGRAIRFIIRTSDSA
jgi:hypothetical protein